MKTCSKCGEVKPLDGFHKDRTKKAGVHSSCKDCVKEKTAKYNKNNADILRLKRVAWRTENPEKNKALRAVQYQRNIKKNRARCSDWKIKNPKKIKAYSAEYYKLNANALKEKTKAEYRAEPEKFRAKQKSYRLENLESCNERAAAYVNAMPNTYIIRLVSRRYGLPKELITQDLIQAKRIHLQIVRKLKELKA